MNVHEAIFAQGSARVRFQWEESNLYILMTVIDPQVERVAISQWPGPCPVEDHVDIFLTGMPAVAQRPYGPADTHFTIDLTGQLFVHHENPRLRGAAPANRSEERRV